MFWRRRLTIRIKVIRAQNLLSKDGEEPTSYITVSVGKEKDHTRTKEDVNPRWDQPMEFKVDPEHPPTNILLRYQLKSILISDTMGTARIPLTSFFIAPGQPKQYRSGEQYAQWFPLTPEAGSYGAMNGGSVGEVLVNFGWMIEHQDFQDPDWVEDWNELLRNMAPIPPIYGMGGGMGGYGHGAGMPYGRRGSGMDDFPNEYDEGGSHYFHRRDQYGSMPPHASQSHYGSGYTHQSYSGPRQRTPGHTPHGPSRSQSYHTSYGPSQSFADIGPEGSTPFMNGDEPVHHHHARSSPPSGFGHGQGHGGRPGFVPPEFPGMGGPFPPHPMGGGGYGMDGLGGGGGMYGAGMGMGPQDMPYSSGHGPSAASGYGYGAGPVPPHPPPGAHPSMGPHPFGGMPPRFGQQFPTGYGQVPPFSKYSGASL
ncbi:hypothetical protein IWQ60_002177 [Tieghemiomyces parasiticus]|uniref:C2 domain-containing protein n=1 Tax=Tieghemiomyces parasiticus TaxID=78921 RepID=A0A9W8ACS0_9FUNG|nr:hypothetical protein IWQ60_002177 [Tieghemiomyces parasiticus]